MILNPDFKEFIQSLNDNEVQYLIVGGYAVAFHGHPRYTKDLDVWINRTLENASRMLKALDQFGFGSLDLLKEDFLDPNQVIQLGIPPNRIDVLSDLKEVSFKNCYSNKVEIEIDEITVSFIDLESLKKNKKLQADIRIWLILKTLADLMNLTNFSLLFLPSPETHHSSCRNSSLHSHPE